MVDHVDPSTAEVHERLAAERIRAFLNRRRHLSATLRILIHSPRNLFTLRCKGIVDSRLDVVVPLADHCVGRMRERFVAVSSCLHQ
jgi:hypothetical protein